MRRRGSGVVGIIVAIACGDRGSGADARPATTPIAATQEVLPPAPRSPPPLLGEILDLVPTNAKQWVAIRDPFALVDGLEWATRGQREPWALLARAYAPTSIREVLVALPQIDQRLGGSGVHLDRGLVIASVDDGMLVVVAADDAEKFPTLLRALGDADTSLACEAVASHPGFQVCGAEAVARAGYRATGGGATARDALATMFGADSVSDVDAVADLGGLPITVTARDAILHVVFGFGPQERDLGKPRVPTTMAALVAGSSLLWMSDDPLAMVERIVPTLADAELVTDAILATSGEMLLASPGGPLGLVLVAGAKQPATLRRLVRRVPEILPRLRALLPGLSATTETTGSGPHACDVAIAELDVTEEQRRQLEQGELQARAMLIASDAWLIATLGLGQSALIEMCEHPIAPVPEDLLGALPPAMSAALAGGRSSFALHLELDGLHAPDARRFLLDVLGDPEHLLGDLERSTALLSLMSSVSSVSLWSDLPGEAVGGTFHVALRAFGDGRTAEGQKAYTARLDAEDGESPARVYGALRHEYDRSPRAYAYVARAGVGGIQAAYPVIANVMIIDALIRAARGPRPGVFDGAWWSR